LAMCRVQVFVVDEDRARIREPVAARPSVFRTASPEKKSSKIFIVSKLCPGERIYSKGRN
ncbi:hypothetical protein, partial [Leptospira kirschneri]